MAQNTAQLGTKYCFTVIMFPEISYTLGKEQETLESSHVYVICAGF